MTQFEVSSQTQSVIPLTYFLSFPNWGASFPWPAQSSKLGDSEKSLEFERF